MGVNPCTPHQGKRVCEGIWKQHVQKKTFWQQREEIKGRTEENVIICTLQANSTITKAIKSRRVTGENLMACVEDVRNAYERSVAKCEWWDRRGWENCNATNWLDYDMIWYMIWYGIWYGILFDMVWYMVYDLIWYDIWYTIWYDIWYRIWYGMIYGIWYDMVYDMIWYMIWYGIWYMWHYMIRWYDIYDIWYDIFNCDWVSTLWQ